MFSQMGVLDPRSVDVCRAEEGLTRRGIGGTELELPGCLTPSEMQDRAPAGGLR